MDNYFAANPISAWFMVAATVCAVLTALVALLRVADAHNAARELARLERDTENRHRQVMWAWCCLAADGLVPTPTRRISWSELLAAGPDIARELSRTEQFAEAVIRG